MVEKALNHRWYRRVARKAAKSDNRKHHYTRSKHTYEEFYREARINSNPPTETKSSFFALGCIDIPKSQDHQRPEPQAQSRFDSFRASMAGIFEERIYNSSFRNLKERDIPELPSRSARRIFPYVKSESYHEDYVGSSGSSRNHDPYHADEIRYTRFNEPSPMRRRSEAVSKDKFKRLYDDPYFYNESPTSNTHGIMDPYEDYACAYDGTDEEDMSRLLSPSIISLYQQNADSSSHLLECADVPENIIRIESTPLHDDKALFDRASCRIYDSLTNHVPDAPVSEQTLKEIMLDAAGVVTEMMESIFPRDTMFPNQKPREHEDVPFMRLYLSEPSHTDPGDFIQRMALHTQPQPQPQPQPQASPPPPPRPQFVDPYHIPLRHSEPEPALRRQPTNVDPKAELNRYNKWWTDAQTKALPQDEVLDNIPYLSPPTSNSHSTSTHDWTWTTHQFFCRAFELQPLSIPQQDTSNLNTFTPPPLTSPTTIKTNLLALRAQLKLEKVRWHEDKLRLLFGDEVARDERSKCVWGAVMGLKGVVERALDEV